MKIEITENKFDENNHKIKKYHFQSKNTQIIKNNQLFDIIQFEKNLYETKILDFISQESFEDQLFEDENVIDKFIEFILTISSSLIKNINNLTFYDKKYSFGIIERFKIVHWLSLHSYRLKFQSCTFHLSCRILDIYLLESEIVETKYELATYAAASFLLASSIIETTSDMIVPTIKQFCDAAKWLNSKKIIMTQIEILTRIKKNFKVTLTPLKLLLIYISKIKNHLIMKKEFDHILKNKKIIEILNFCLGICDLTLYNPITTNRYGQLVHIMLPSFILWNQLNSNYKSKVVKIEYIKNLFFTEICLFGKIFNEEIIDTIYNIANELIKYNEKQVKDFNNEIGNNRDRLRIHKHIPYKIEEMQIKT